ncbi:Vegetative incompatibility protein HET-E-1, partial [Lachnellula suecica]
MNSPELERQKSVASTSKRSFLSRTLTRRDAGGEAVEDVKGPFGLNTLFDPAESAIADLVFVHGLGGGSRSTWTKSNDPALYWPEQWLPNDYSFRDVRIHSFGYNSNWDKESTLNIHDFAKSLLGAIVDCPLIPRGTTAPLVLVGHSMGGLVIKRAFILAKQKEEFYSLAQRIGTILFLATPHRGADLAQLLTKMLNLSSGNRPFVTDLHRNSLATQSINDEFPQHCQELQLYSFYETLPTSFGVTKSLVVDKDLATLGYANERTSYLNANHRDVCKYDDTSDPNYRTVRNALASTFETFRDSVVLSKRDLHNDQRKILSTFLGESDATEDDFMGIDGLRMEGSCEWLTNKESFQAWQNSLQPQMYWMSGKPATGKTVLSGKTVAHLRGLHMDCAFYFFNFRNKTKSSIHSFLLSMAWQMSLLHTGVLNVVLDIFEKDDQLSKADYRTIWRKLFLEGILTVHFPRPQYWVIDALDECKADSDLVPLLLKLLETGRVRVFLTSRNTFESHRQLVHSKAKVISEEVLAHDTKSDIALYLEANMHDLPSVDENARQQMLDTILSKSAGCFLWVTLVMQELRRVHTSVEIRLVLENVPSDMSELYSRILDSMSQSPYGKMLAKTILIWAVCSARPLTTNELHHALQIDLKDTIDSIERSIASSCGQLVFIDPQSRVQIVHQTARDYLISAYNTSEFSIDKRLGSTQLAMTCLTYLNGKEMQGPFIRKLSLNSIVKERSPFAHYACTSFFHHIVNVPSTNDDVMSALSKFLSSSNVLVWIEYIAQHSDLNLLIQAGKVFKNYLQRRSSHVSPLGKDVALIDTWSTDLLRLVTKFGKKLSSSPSAIFNLIPPFCPPETCFRKQFGSSARGIGVFGLSATSWDDCLSTIVDPQEQFLALACSKTKFAIGTSSGKIKIHNQTTCQEVQTLQHQEPVRLLQFGQKRRVLVSAGSKTIRVWDTGTWEEVQSFEIPQQCMLLALADEDQLLLAALKSNCLMVWDLTAGYLRDSINWTEGLDGTQAHAFRRPTFAAISLELSLLAVVYRGQEILLWDLDQEALYETYNKESGASFGRDTRPAADAGAICVVFCTAPDTSLLAAAYSGGELVLFDTSAGMVKSSTIANAQVLACSPDGRTLASGDSSGIIQLFEFETLKLLYRIYSEDYGIRELVFSGDGQHLLDIRGSQCRVWDPPVLVRQELDDENSDTISVSTAQQEMRPRDMDDAVLITSIACHGNGEFVFCGKEGGSVYLYETKTGRQDRKLFSHAGGVSIVSLQYDDESETLTSIDDSSRILSHRISHPQKGFTSPEKIFDQRASDSVEQLLSNAGHTRLLISSAEKDTLWSLSPS